MFHIEPAHARQCSNAIWHCFRFSFHALFQFHLRLVAQFFAGRGDVAAPVTLFQDIVFVIVQGCYLACHPTNVFTEESDDAQHPGGGSDAQPPGASQFLMDEVAEGAALIRHQGRPSSSWIKSLKVLL